MQELAKALRLHFRTYELKDTFHHHHPYKPFIPAGSRKIIVGTLPPPRFSTRELKERDVDFCYGSQDGMLWPVLERIYRLKLLYDNSLAAVRQRKEFLRKHHLGICDIVESCLRRKMDASDLGMEQIQCRDILGEIKRHPKVDTLLFMGGNSKNGPEYLFRKEVKKHGLYLECRRRRIPKVHSIDFTGRSILTISLTSPSNAANRAIGSTQHYKTRRQQNPSYSTFDYRIDQYREIFIEERYLGDDFYSLEDDPGFLAKLSL